MEADNGLVLPPSRGKVREEDEAQYGSIPIESLKLSDKWVVWESLKYDPNAKVSMSQAFIDNNQKLFQFDEVHQLAQIWRSKIGTVSQCFSTPSKPYRVLDGNSKYRTIESICIFKSGIQPAWEDPMNERGGELLVQLEMNENGIEVVDKVFRDIICTILSQSYRFAKETNGVRVVDKSRERIKIRFEIWVTFDRQLLNQESLERVDAIRSIFKQIFERHTGKVQIEFRNHTR